MDRELSDVFPGAKDLLYYFLDASEVITASHLDNLLREANIDEQDREKVVDFLLYYGILGTRLGETDHFIYSVNYDLKVLRSEQEDTLTLQTTSSILRFGRPWASGLSGRT